MDIKSLLLPRFEIIINDKKTKYSPHSLNLRTAVTIPSTYCKLVLPANSEIKDEDKVKIQISYKNEFEDVLFSGTVLNSSILKGKKSLTLCDDSYLLKKKLSFSFRKEKLKNIISHILNECEISKSEIDVPDITLEQYSALNKSGLDILFGLKAILFQEDGKKYDFLFDKENQFYFAQISKISKNLGKKYDLKTEKNIISKSYDFFETFLLPIRAYQEISLDDKTVYPICSCLFHSSTKFRSYVYFKEEI